MYVFIFQDKEESFLNLFATHLLVEKGKNMDILKHNGETVSDFGKNIPTEAMSDIFDPKNRIKRDGDDDDEKPSKKPKLDDDQPSTSGGKRKLEDPDDKDVKRRKMLDNMEIPSGGSKSAQHGNIFQLKLLMLYLARGILQKYPQFRLATELDEAGKFDDVVFQYLKNDIWSLRLIQAKHKEGETPDSLLPIINLTNLLSMDEKEEFSIPKYFNSYLEILQRVRENSIYSVFPNSEVEDILLITNTNFGDKVKDYFEVNSAYDIENDLLLKVDKANNPQWKNANIYKLKDPKNNPLVSKLKPILESDSHFYKLLEDIMEPIIQGGKHLEKTGLIKNYYYVLIRELFDIKTINKPGGKEYELEFKSNFLDGTGLSEEAIAFRNAIVKELAFMIKGKNEINLSEEFGQGKLQSGDIEPLAKKIAECALTNKPNKKKASDFGNFQVLIRNEVINPLTKKFHPKFIKGTSKDNKVKELKDRVKMEIAKKVPKVTIKYLENDVEFIIPYDFGESTLPEDPGKLKKLASTLAKAIKDKAELKPSLSEEFQAYHTALTDEVIDKNSKTFQLNFINGKVGKGALAKSLPPITKQFRNMLLNELITVDNKQSFDMLKTVNIKVTKGFAEDFRPTSDFIIENLPIFSKQLENLLTQTTGNVIEINDKTVDKQFEVNLQKLAGYVLSTKFKKIRFSSAFIHSDKLPGNLMQLKNELKANLGNTKFESLYNYEFNIKGLKFKTCEDGALFRKLPVLHKESQIFDFCDKFKFLVNHPNRKEISKLVTGELQHIFQDLDSRVSHSLYLETMHDWMADRIGTFLTPTKAEHLFKDVAKQVKFMEMEGITKYYFDRFSSDYKFVKDYDFVINFLQGKQEQVLHLVTDNVKLSSVKMAQILLDIKDNPAIKQYVWGLGLVFISSNQLSHKNSYITDDVLGCFKDPTRTNLLVVPSNDKQNDVDDLATSLLTTLEDNSGKKIILITKEGDDLAKTISKDRFIKSRNKYIAKNDMNTLNNLNPESQKKVLDIEVNFQGRKVKLGHITGGDESLKEMINSKVLYEIITNKEISIGSDLRKLEEIFEYYIPRSFTEHSQINPIVLYKQLPNTHFVVVDLDGKIIEGLLKNVYIFKDNQLQAETKYNELRQAYPDDYIHWLQMESGKLIWKQSHGSLSDLFQYRILSGRETSLSENKLIENDSDRVVIISDQPGTGKSTVLTSLGRKLQIKYPGVWVMRINLLDYVNELSKIKSIGNYEEAVNFLLDSLSNSRNPQLRNDLEKVLFRRSLDKEDKIALLFDGFDEISPIHKDVVVQLLVELKKSKIKKMIVTTRVHMRETLENTLGTYSRMLEPFTKQNQREFLWWYWQSKISILNSNQLNKLVGYVNDATSDLFILNKGIEDFTGVPLQMRMIAEYFETTVKEWQELPENLNLNALYEGFIKAKYDVFRIEKEKKDLSNPLIHRGEALLYKKYLIEHKQMALYTLFNEDDLKSLTSTDFKEEMKALLEDIQIYHETRGLINNIINNKPQFIHRTIAEYFAAQFFSEELNQPKKLQVQHFILKKVLVEREYKYIRAFMNDQLTGRGSDAIGNVINTLWLSENRLSTLYNIYSQNLLHISAEEGHRNIMAFILDSLGNHQETRRQLLASQDSNGLSAADIAAMYDHRNILEMLRNDYRYTAVNTDELRSEIFAKLKGNNEQVEVAKNKLRNIAEMCISRITLSRRRRNVGNKKCAISWWDIDKISDTQTRDIQDIRIDSAKFLEYTKTITSEAKNAQLLELVQVMKIVDADNIVGKRKHILDQVIADEGYKNFIQKERIHELTGKTIESPTSKISPVLKKRLLNAAGKVHMTMTAYGAYSTIMMCSEGMVTNCALSLGGIGYSIISRPIESAVLKITPRIVSQAEHAGAKIVPRILGQDTKFLIQYGGAKYGAKIVRGLGGVLGGVFDIVDAGISANALIECGKRKDTDNPCSDKEIRDNIAGISFAAVSFVTGIALTLSGATFGISVAVGFVIMAVSALYNGISNIVEYEEKYDTTHWENFRIFWHTVALRPMPEDVVHLAARSDYVNSITKQAADQLFKMGDNLVGYAFGLGKIQVNGGDASFQRASSFIDLSKANIKRYSLSRVLPKDIDGVKPICLPRKTGSIYEYYNEESYDSYRSKYYCENGVVIVSEERISKKPKIPTIFYDFTHIDGGYVAGNSSVQNLFYLKQGKPVVRGGGSTSNNFVIIDSDFAGAIQADWNSTNIIDVSQLENHMVTLSWKNKQPLYMYLDLTIETLQGQGKSKTIVPIEKFQRESIISYKSGNKILDHINCVMMDVYMDHNLLVDSGGGTSEENKDRLVGCTDAVVWPNTIIESKKGNYTFYIRTEGYEADKATSEIDVIGEGIITFPELILLKDCHQITYSSSSNILSFKLPLNKNGIFTLHLKNYLNKNKATNFMLVDKLGNYIVPKLFDKEVVDMFELNAVYADTNELSAAVEHYDKLLSSISLDYKVFGLVKFLTDHQGTQKKAMFGSHNGDIFVFDNSTIYARGNSGSDVYIVNKDASWASYKIDNYANDLVLDALGIFFKAELNVTKVNGKDLRLTVGDDKFIDVSNYFEGEKYRHLMVVDHESQSYLPFHSDTLQLVPFYHASDKKNVFVISNTRAIIDCDFDNMVYYKRDDSLLISSKTLSDTFGALSVILKFYYTDKDAWKNAELYSYSRGSYKKIDLNGIKLTSASNDDVYSQIIKEYVVDFNKPYTEIAHNQNNSEVSMFREKEKIGVLIFKDFKPQHIEVVRSNDDVIFKDKEYLDQVVIKNWNKDYKYAMSIIEFDFGIEPIRIFLSDKDVDLQDKLNDAKELENVQTIIGDDANRMLKCTLAINCLHVTNSYRALGFTYFEQAATFIKNCDFPQFKLHHLRGIKIFLPAKFLQIYSLKAQLEGGDKLYRDIADVFSQILDKVNSRIEIDLVLENQIREIDDEVQKAVEYFLLMSCSTYGGNNVLSETLKLKPSINTIIEPKLFVKTMLLFMAKSHNEGLFKYPQLEKNTTLEIDYNNLRILDITIVDSIKNNEINKNIFTNFKMIIQSKIEKIAKALSSSHISTIRDDWGNYVKNNILNLLSIDEQTTPFTAIKVELKKKKIKTSNGQGSINHRRQERDAFEDFVAEDFSTSGASSGAHNSLINTAFKWLNPVTWFTSFSGNFNQLNEGATQFFSNLKEIPTTEAFPSTLDFSSHNVNSTLLLMNVLTRKYTGERYFLTGSGNYDRYKEGVQKEEANCLAYNYYCPKM